jgi:hypothetical protein
MCLAKPQYRSSRVRGARPWLPFEAYHSLAKLPKRVSPMGAATGVRVGGCHTPRLTSANTLASSSSAFCRVQLRQLSRASWCGDGRQPGSERSWWVCRPCVWPPRNRSVCVRAERRCFRLRCLKRQSGLRLPLRLMPPRKRAASDGQADHCTVVRNVVVNARRTDVREDRLSGPEATPSVPARFPSIFV